MRTKPTKRAKQLSPPPTRENLDLVKRVFSKPEMLDGVAEVLLANPVLRPLVWWTRVVSRSGLSPFSLAGITGIPPKTVVQMLGKTGLVDPEFCFEVRLPVFFISWQFYWDSLPSRKRPFDLKEALSDWNASWFCSNEAKSPIPDMFKRFAGRYWRRHCTRKFSGTLGPKSRNEISLKDWREMQRVYLLKEQK